TAAPTGASPVTSSGGLSMCDRGSGSASSSVAASSVGTGSSSSSTSIAASAPTISSMTASSAVELIALLPSSRVFRGRAASRRYAAARVGSTAREAASPLVEPAQLLLELARELVELRAARGDEVELLARELDRAVDDRDPLLVCRVAVPLVAQRCARLLGLGERDQLLERQPEQVTQADQLAQPRDVGVGVLAMRALAARVAPAEQAE